MSLHYDVVTSLCYDVLNFITFRHYDVMTFLFLTLQCHYLTLWDHNVEISLSCILMSLLYDAILHDIITLHYDVMTSLHYDMIMLHCDVMNITLLPYFMTSCYDVFILC